MKRTLAIDAVRSAVERMPDDGLTTARKAAFAHLHQHGLPTTTHEDWKYTDLARVIDVSNEWLAAGAGISPVSDKAVSAITGQFDADWLVIRNGVVDSSTVAELDQVGLNVELFSASGSMPEIDAPLSGLNVALLQDGLSIRVAADTNIERTIGLLVIDSADSAVGVSQARIQIEIEVGSCANFIEYHASVGAAAHYANSVVDVTLAENAQSRYVRIQDRASTHNQTGRLSATLSQNSQLQHAAFDLGGDLVRNDLAIDLAGTESSASFYGLYLAGGAQHIDNHTRVDHRVGPARSQQEYRGILTDASRCVWNGKAVVHAGADGTDANQANHNLLLSESAEIDAKPELEIYTDDVKASHGTTIGQLDKNALFYLRTRGLDEASARRLLTRAFAQKIVAISPILSIQETISEMVANRVAELIAGEPK
ncbi:MAG: Fe-S cluster assembly protein SufD [Woeseiaceae bacterium]